jgi:hypothetical protein
VEVIRCPLLPGLTRHMLGAAEPVLLAEQRD